MGRRTFNLARGFLYLLAFLLFQAQAATLLIVTDEATATKANEVKQVFEMTPPFSKLENFKIMIRVAPVGSIPCDQNGRKMYCNQAILTQLAAAENADRILFIENYNVYGGSAQNFTAAMTTAAPAFAGVHEILHTFGLADEYQYPEREAYPFCVYWMSQHPPNVAILAETPPYASDQEARSKHAHEIPWYSKILGSTLITTGTYLGTPTPGLIGLYRSKTCLPWSSWKPGDVPTVMELNSTNYVPELYWPAVTEGLHTRILPEQAPPTPPTTATTQKNQTSNLKH